MNKCNERKRARRDSIEIVSLRVQKAKCTPESRWSWRWRCEKKASFFLCSLVFAQTLVSKKTPHQLFWHPNSNWNDFGSKQVQSIVHLYADRRRLFCSLSNKKRTWTRGCLCRVFCVFSLFAFYCVSLFGNGVNPNRVRCNGDVT